MIVYAFTLHYFNQMVLTAINCVQIKKIFSNLFQGWIILVTQTVVRRTISKYMISLTTITHLSLLIYLTELVIFRLISMEKSLSCLVVMLSILMSTLPNTEATIKSFQRTICSKNFVGDLQ